MTATLVAVSTRVAVKVCVRTVVLCDLGRSVDQGRSCSDFTVVLCDLGRSAVLGRSCLILHCSLVRPWSQCGIGSQLFLIAL